MKNWDGEKFRGQSARNFFTAPLPLFQFAPPPNYWGHMPFCPPVEAIHAVTIMSLKPIGISVDIVLNSSQIH